MAITKIKLLLTVQLFLMAIFSGNGIFVDVGNPYKDGPLPTGEIIFSKSIDGSPLHTKVFFPIPINEYPAVYFIGGLNGIVLVEFYEIFLTKLASHGFFVIGVDYEFPVYAKVKKSFKPFVPPLGDAADKFYEQLAWVKPRLENRTMSTVVWDKTALLCHSSGCDSTLKMILRNNTYFKATLFLEPASFEVGKKIDFHMPAFMYGTELSEVGPTHCAIKGFDWNAFYDSWTCPRIKMEVANFGHCDILDPVPWSGCHATHFCTTTNDTHLVEYRQFVQGVVSSFLISELQGRPQDLVYITDRNRVPLQLLQLESDFNCTKVGL